MDNRNALEIFRQQAKKNPKLQAAYDEEKKKYQIACKIRECRNRKKLTQKALAFLIGTKQSVISRLENAEYTEHYLNIIKKIADATNEPLSAFIEIEKPEAQDPKIIEWYAPTSFKIGVNRGQAWHTIGVRLDTLTVQPNLGRNERVFWGSNRLNMLFFVF